VIRTIRLTNWRAYARLDLELTRPVTFLVAPNGVGKSSLVEAVRWGLLGMPEDRTRGRAVRGDSTSATVHLQVDLPGGASVEVTRTLKRGGATTFRAVYKGTELGEPALLDEPGYLTTLCSAWASHLPLLDALLFGPTLSSKDTGFPVRDHLADIFGVTRLIEAAGVIKERRTELAAHIKTLKADLSGSDEAIEAAAELVASLTIEVNGAAAVRDQEASAVETAEATAALAANWERYRREATAASAQARDLVADMTLLFPVDEDDPLSAIETREREATATLDSSRASSSSAHLRAASASSAVELLAETVDRCPTCLRPLSEKDRASALAQHGHTASDSSSEIQRLEEATELARQRLAAISQLRRALSAIGRPLAPQHADPGPEAVAKLEEARQTLTLAAERFGALSSQLESARGNLQTLRQAATDQIALVRSEREDVVLGITQRTLDAVANRSMTRLVEPLAHEIGRRWKLVFGNDGLRFDADGKLQLNHEGTDVGIHDFSGGERSTALLVTRLMLGASATRASTMWFDEPLEHLDPRRRAAVAQTIVRAAQTATMDQIIVTTYEEGIARQLAATAPDDVDLVYARDAHLS
jgi:DNA repair exonuclease SbcCD ATPase subunit